MGISQGKLGPTFVHRSGALRCDNPSNACRALRKPKTEPAEFTCVRFRRQTHAVVPALFFFHDSLTLHLGISTLEGVSLTMMRYVSDILNFVHVDRVVVCYLAHQRCPTLLTRRLCITTSIFTMIDDFLTSNLDDSSLYRKSYALILTTRRHKR